MKTSTLSSFEEYHLVAEQTDFLVVQNIHAFVFAQFGFGGDESRRVGIVYAGPAFV